MADPETSIPTAPDQDSKPPASDQDSKAPDQDSKPPASDQDSKAPDQDSKPPAPTVEPEEVKPRDPGSEKHDPKKPSGISLSIWPPSQRTRDAVIARLIETLSSQSVLSKRYGTISDGEAQEVARVIEEEAFALAGGFGSAGDDGIEILQIYSKEISKRMLEKVKARAGSVSGSVDAIASQSPSEPPTTASEEKSSAETEA